MKNTNQNERSKLMALCGVALLIAVAAKGASASDVLVQPNAGYRVVVVEEAQGSRALMAGHYAGAARLGRMEIGSSNAGRI